MTYKGWRSRKNAHSQKKNKRTGGVQWTPSETRIQHLKKDSREKTNKQRWLKGHRPSSPSATEEKKIRYYSPEAGGGFKEVTGSCRKR